MSEIQDFGYADTSPIRFKVQGQEYEAKPRMGATAMLDLVSGAVGENVDRTTQLEVFDRFMALVLTPESYTRFTAAMGSQDPEAALDMGQVIAITRWLTGEMTGRPTESSGDSPD